MLTNGVLFSDSALVFFTMIALTAFAIWAEKKWKWAGLLSALGICVFGALILVSLKILPTTSPAYDAIFNYFVLLPIPMILINANLKRIVRDSGRSFILMNVACVGACLGGIAVGFIFRNNEFVGPDIAGYVAMEVGVCTGGMANQAAMAQTFDVSANVVSSAGVGGCLVAVLFLVCVAMIPNLKFFRQHFNHPHVDEAEAGVAVAAEDSTVKEPFSIFDLGKTFAFAFGILGISNVISNLVYSLSLPSVVTNIFGNSYLLTVIFTVLVSTLFPKFASSIKYGQEIGMFMLLTYMAAVGTGATIMDVLAAAPVVIFAEIVIILIIMVLVFLVGKIFKMDLEEMLIAINASYGGPNTAAALVGTKGWTKLAVPAVLIGVYGIVVGNVLGILIGNLFL